MIRTLLFFCVLGLSAPAFAQDDGSFDRRFELAGKMLEIRPAQEQVDSAIDSYIRTYMLAESLQDQELFRAAMTRVMNAKALEKITRDAYAETFTEQELSAMVEYYAKPEARSAGAKQAEFHNKIAPEIVRMLDQAAMQVRTGR